MIEFSRNLILLFNGAEESVLPASHAFVTQHKSVKEIKAFINLEAAGAGGREMLFQAGPKKRMKLIEAYLENAPKPCAHIAAQELFQVTATNLINV